MLAMESGQHGPMAWKTPGFAPMKPLGGHRQWKRFHCVLLLLPHTCPLRRQRLCFTTFFHSARITDPSQTLPPTDSVYTMDILLLIGRKCSRDPMVGRQGGVSPALLLLAASHSSPDSHTFQIHACMLATKISGGSHKEFCIFALC
jgi:hypothetical protein